MKMKPTLSIGCTSRYYAADGFQPAIYVYYIVLTHKVDKVPYGYYLR